MRYVIEVSVRRRLQHRWPGVLRMHPHFFIFSIKVLEERSRDIAFEQVKKDLVKVVKMLPHKSDYSCEDFCKIIYENLRGHYKIVSISVYENFSQGATLKVME